MPILDLQNVSFKYAREWVLDDVSLRVGEGEFAGIIGPNGSGKTTLLRLMDGILKPERGTIELKGQKLPEMSRRSIAKQIAVVPQETPLTFPFSVREIVMMG